MYRLNSCQDDASTVNSPNFVTVAPATLRRGPGTIAQGGRLHLSPQRSGCQRPSDKPAVAPSSRQHLGPGRNRGSERRRQQFRIYPACASRHLHAQRNLRHQPYRDQGMGSRTPYNTNRIKAYLNDIPITIRRNPLARRYRPRRHRTNRDHQGTGIGTLRLRSGRQHQSVDSGSTWSSFTARLQVGSFNTAKASAGGSYVRDDLKISGNVGHIRSDGFRENNRLRRTSLLSSGRLEKSAHTLEYTLLLLEMDAAIPSSIGKTLFETDPGAAAPNWKAIEGFKRYGRGVAGISLENRLGEGWVNRLTTFGRWTESYENVPSTT